MNKHILVIEDNLEVRENLAEILELSGYDVTTAEDGKVGVEQAVAVQPDLILCDVMMPRLDGYGVLNILNKRAETADIPFIFLTAKTEKEDMRRGMLLGADDYVTKPFYKDELLQVVEMRLQKSERLKQSFQPNATGFSAFVDAARGYEELEKLSADRRTRSYDRKEIIFYEDDYPRYLFLLQSGQVKLYKTNEYDKEYILRTIQPGEYFGYTALIENGHYAFRAAALDQCEVVLIPREEFTQLLYANRDVAARFIQLLANNIHQKEDQLIKLAYDSVRKRTADALLECYRNQGAGEAIDILREDLARMVGTAKESVIRMLTEFKNDGLIAIEDGKIQLLNAEKLAQVPG